MRLNCSILNRSVFKTQTHLNRKRSRFLVPLSFERQFVPFGRVSAKEMLEFFGKIKAGEFTLNLTVHAESSERGKIWSSALFLGFLISLDAVFLLTVGSFLLTMELFCLQSCLGAFLLTVGAFLLTILAFLLTIEACLLTVGKCVS